MGRYKPHLFPATAEITCFVQSRRSVAIVIIPLRDKADGRQTKTRIPGKARKGTNVRIRMMDTAVAVVSGILNSIRGSVKFIFTIIAAILSLVYAICSSPVRLAIALLSWITFPFRYTASLTWEACTDITRWFFDEFEVVINYLILAVVLGSCLALVARGFVYAANSIFNAARDVDRVSKEDVRRIRDEDTPPTSPAASDFDLPRFTHKGEDTISPYHRRTGTGKPRAAPGPLLGQAIHEEDSSS
ncbi:hypothetical protein QBC34DRAFT_394546 [Podospora aff. communis PSN243]|uniref:Uncharacterized protein n=1 Tax=Podospora aff. communis PSN243 TaxID=3040156 RepID=A0AAV9H3X3_9PEZI|nr:hypothetical protein QBC34DRAFT_394546 [Podospora aff. communis PSN243]